MSRRIPWFELTLLALILVVAALLRWYGLGWDDGYLFHPDERQILLVVSKLALPATALEFFSPDSPLNPKFFAYGSLPIYLLRALAPFAPPTSIVGPWADDTLARWALFGRALSGLFDLGTIVLTYVLGRRVYHGRIGLIAAAAVAISVLHVQLSHFYAVDTLLTFFTLATLYAAFRIAQKTTRAENSKNTQTENANEIPRGWLVVCGICYGLAMATKFTALPLIVPIFYACYCVKRTPAQFKFSRVWLADAVLATWRPAGLVAGIALGVFLITQPYVLIDWYTFGRDVLRETFVARGWLDYPYTRQYVGTIPLVYPIVQSSVWGLGLPLGVFAWVGGALFLFQWWKTRDRRDSFLLSFALVYFLVIGLQYAKYLRYLLPLLPVLYIIAACAWLRLLARRRVLLGALVAAVLVCGLLYSVAYIRIYSNEHPWLTASRWIYENVEPGKTLAIEQWDDALPTLIPFPTGARRGSDYPQIALPMYDDDSDAKRMSLADTLAEADLVVLASQRLYGSIGRLPVRYPMTIKYYQELFNGDLGFEPVFTKRNDPNLLGISIRDDPRTGLAFDASSIDKKLGASDGQTVWDWGFADESFSVYDHPQPILFRKVTPLSAKEIQARLAP